MIAHLASSPLSRLDPKNWVRPDTQEFTMTGTLTALGLAAYSQIGETIATSQRLWEALTNDIVHLSLSDEMLHLETRERAQRALRRVTTTKDLPLGEANPLRDQPPAQISRPVLLVPGWDTPHDRFRPLTDKLTEGGANGGQTIYVQEGRFYADQSARVPLAPEQVPPEAKVFVTVFQSTSQSPLETAPQLAKNLAAMAELQPGPPPDVVAYSQGGLAIRHYLDQPEAQIGRLLQVGTPNLGAGLASLSHFVFQAQERGFGVDHLLQSNHLDPEDRPSMEYMAVASPHLQQLNAGWPAQVARTEGFQVVGHAGQATFDFGIPPWAPGDGLVAGSHLAPPGVTPVLVDGPYSGHTHLPYHPDVYATMRSHFSWR